MLQLFIVWFLLSGLLIAAPQNSPSGSRKPGGDWSQASADRLLNDSPWAMPVPATMDDPSEVAEPNQAPLPGAETAGMPGKSQGAARWDGGVGRNRMGHLPTIPVTVRWESASVMQAALAQSHKALKNSAETDNPGASRAKDYILSVTGLIPSHRYRTKSLAIGKKSSSDGDTSDPTDPEEVLESFMANSRLVFKGGSIQPENVRLDADTGAIHIFFPRADLSQRTKEVFFATSFGSMHVQARFRLKDMSVQGKLDL